MKLIDCPVGLFWYDDTLCFKSEYFHSDGRVYAFIIESGEYLSAGGVGVEEFNNLEVTPLEFMVRKD